MLWDFLSLQTSCATKKAKKKKVCQMCTIATKDISGLTSLA